MTTTMTYSGSANGTPQLSIPASSTLSTITLLNTTAAVAYLQMFKTGNVTGLVVGTTKPDWSIGLPANGGAVVTFPQGQWWPDGLVVVGTTTRSGSTGAAIDINIAYSPASQP